MTRLIEELASRRLLSGEWDLSFGEGGAAVAPGDGNGNALVVHEISGGKIVAAGKGYPEGPLVARFNADGSPDASFDGDGSLQLPQKDYGNVTAGALAPDGKIVLLFHGLGPLLRVFRFNADGTVDASFGSGGSVTQSLTKESFSDERVAVQSDGKIVLAYIAGGEKASTYVTRLNANGSIDGAFRGGASATPLPGDLGYVNDLTIGPTGKIYVLAGANLLRLKADGTMDTTFGGGDGIASAPYDSIALTPEGKVVMATTRGYFDSSKILVTRLLGKGSVDKSFGANGVTTIATPNATPEVNDLLVMPDGKIVSAGYPFRLNSDGRLDTSFGNEGIAPRLDEYFTAETLTLDSKGNVLFAGDAASLRGGGLAVARLVADSPEVALSSQGDLFVRGTNEADVVTLERAGDQVVLTRNGEKMSFAASAVKVLTVFGRGGGDAVTCTVDLTCSINGGEGNDTITLAGGDATIFGEGGNDRIKCGIGNRFVQLGPGNDRFIGGRGKDNIFGSDGNDTITTGAGSDRITGEEGDDSIACGSGWDTIYAENGNDIVHGGAGNDLITDFDQGDGSTEVAYNTGEATGHKRYYGDDGKDTLYGSTEADTLYGNGQVDLIYAYGGADVISGGGGDDILWGYSPSFYELTYKPELEGRNTIHGGEGQDELTGSVQNDKLWGDAGNDSFSGGLGNDIIRGGDGNDRISGDEGQDQVVGDAGDDIIFASDGDLARGGTGNDWIKSKNKVSDQIFGDEGRDTCLADSKDVLKGIEVRQ
ncbi:MAG TPA: hypothetical protein VF669_03745 [Tepidisphaeraceae bacterium]|jgi:uncharacterized delta-60 repeat protein